MSSIASGTTTTTGLVYTSDTTGNLVLQTNGTTTAVTIDTAQNVGVGVTPSAWGSSRKAIQVGSSSVTVGHFAGSATNTIFGNNFYNDGTNVRYINAGAPAQAIVMPNDGSFAWAQYTGNLGAGNIPSTSTTAMTLDNSGNLLVGTTSAPNASFACKSNFIGLQTTNPADSTKWRQIVFAANSTDATLYFPNGSNTATLTSAGAWTNASDSRQKTNIVDIKYGLNTVLTVQPHSYNRTDVSGDFIGFVAQELKTIIPEVVFGSEETSYSVDYGSLVAVAFKAIQELSAKVTALEAKVG